MLEGMPSVPQTETLLSPAEAERIACEYGSNALLWYEEQHRKRPDVDTDALLWEWYCMQEFDGVAFDPSTNSRLNGRQQSTWQKMCKLLGFGT